MQFMLLNLLTNNLREHRTSKSEFNVSVSEERHQIAQNHQSSENKTKNICDDWFHFHRLLNFLAYKCSAKVLHENRFNVFILNEEIFIKSSTNKQGICNT